MTTLSGPTVSIWNVCGVFFPPFGAFYPCPNVSAVTLSLQASEVIKSCGSHAMQIILPAVDTQV